MDKRPFLCLGIASFFAALCCSMISLSGMLILAGVSLVVTLVFCVLRRRRWMRCVRWMAAASLLITVLYALKDCTEVYPTLSYADTTVDVTVTVKNELPSASAFIVEVTEGDLENGTRLCLWGYDGVSLEQGDLLCGTLYVTKAFDVTDLSDARYAKANGVYLYAWSSYGSALEWMGEATDLSLWEQKLIFLRKWIHSVLFTNMAFEDAALCESMLIGVRSDLSETVDENFRASGVYHLLVVSGMHLSVISSVILGGLKRLKIKRIVRVATAMVTVVLFMALCGFSASVTRAGVTTLVMLTAMLLHRRADGLNSLGMAAFFMLCIDPYSVFDLGWQLSFAATLGILLLYPAWQTDVVDRAAKALPKWSFLLSPFLSAVGITLSATLTTQPLSALYFGELSPLFLFGNLLCVEAGSLLLIVVILSMCLSSLPLLSDLLFAISHGICEWLRFCTASLADIPIASFSMREPFVTVWLFALTAAVILGYMLWKMRGVRRAVILMCALLFLAVSVSAVVSSGVTTVTPAPSASLCFTVEAKDGCGLVLVGNADTQERAQTLLREEHIRHLNWCLWLVDSSEEMTQMPSLGVPVDHLLLPQSSDDAVRLTAASQVTVLPSIATVTCCESVTLLREGEWYRLLAGDTAFLFASEDVDEPVRDTWEKADVLLLSPAAVDVLSPTSATETVIFADHRHIQTLSESLPISLGNVRFAVERDTAAVLTRGFGDITLRWY